MGSRLVLFVLAVTPFFAVSQSPQRHPPISYCELASQYAKFDHQVIHVRGIYRQGGEISALYGSECMNAVEAWVDRSPDLKQYSSPNLVAKLDALLDSQHRAMIDAEAEFDGPKTVTIPPGTSTGLATLMRSINSRYGHLNQFRFRILLIRIEAVEPVQTAMPWPVPSSGPPPK